MKTIRSNEEREKLIENFKTSGLSITKWCASNHIPRSTLTGWLYDKNSKKTIKEKKAKFVEVALPAAYPKKPDSLITIEYKDFKITVNESIDFKLLENTLKVVAQVNV